MSFVLSAQVLLSRSTVIYLYFYTAVIIANVFFIVTFGQFKLNGEKIFKCFKKEKYVTFRWDIVCFGVMG